MVPQIRSSESPSEAIKRVIANREACQTTKLGDLGEALDSERLNQLQNPPIEFTYCGYHIELDADHNIEIDP